FESRGPSSVPEDEETSLDPPSALVLNVESPGFDPVERAFDTSGVSRFDCGEIRLTRRPAPLTLAPGHGLGPKFLDHTALIASMDPWVAWEVSSGTIASDGSMSVYL